MSDNAITVVTVAVIAYLLYQATTGISAEQYLTGAPLPSNNVRRHRHDGTQPTTDTRGGNFFLSVPYPEVEHLY